ncbi:hypothetical protein T4D_6550, partial [Trichinella pseudospiralis]
MTGRCDSQAEYCTFIKKIFPKLLFIKPPARGPGMEKQQIIVESFSNKESPFDLNHANRNDAQLFQ